jgi:serine/threonine-protein kinase
MSASRYHNQTLAPGLAARLDPVCDRFEADWQAGRRPRLEEFLPLVEESDRPALLRELLALELDHRARRGEYPSLDEYRTRLPAHAAVIETTFAALSSVSLAAPADHTPLADELLPAGTAAPAAAPVQRAGRYEIEAEIARGGMGAVLRARDPELNRALAVKVLLERHRGQPELERRFREEAQVTGQLQHPGIPPVHEVGALIDGRPFFAMKLIRGRTLAELLRERPSPQHDLPRFLAIFQQVCQTLAYAHNKGVIHRDLKPANVMVGAFGEVQVMDWGLAKVLADQPPAPEEAGPQVSAIATIRTGESGLSQAGSVIGTPAYMSPEQARGEVDRLDERCDVFGLGALLCEVLTGQPPYVGATSAAVRHLALIGDLTATLARLSASGADAELVALARGCLAPLAEERLANAQAVEQALAAYLAGVQEKLRRAELDRAAAALRAVEERKRRRLTAVLAGVALAAVVLTGVCWRWVELAHEESRAQTAVQVNHELGRAASLRDQARAIPLTDADRRKESAAVWDEALAAAEKAEAVLGSGPASPETRRLVEELVPALRDEAHDAARDRALLERLDEAREQRAAITDEDVARTSPKAHIVFGHAAADAYAAAFRDYGIDVLALGPAEAARQIRQRSRVSVALAAALDDWLALEFDQPVARRLLDVSREVDPEPFRNRLRAAVAAADRDALNKLAREVAPGDLPVPIALLLADGLHLAGDLGAAVEVLRAAQRRHPDDFWVNDILGVYLSSLDLSRADEAARYFGAALALRPRAHFVWDNLGNALDWQCRWPEAIRAYETALALKGDFLKVKLGLSSVALGQDDPDRALALCQDVVRRKPGFLRAHITLAQVHEFRGEKAEALAAARKAVELGKDNLWARIGLGEALLLNDQPGPALAAYEEALRLAPHLADVHVGIGRVHLVRKDLPAARKAFQQALALAPNNPNIYFWLSGVSAQEGKWEDALVACRHAVSLRPAFWRNHIALGDLLLAMSSPDQAIAAYREAVRLHPASATAHNRLGNGLHEKGDWDQAIAAYEKAIELNPKDPVFYRNLGHSLANKDLLDRALTACEKAAELDPKNAEYQAEVGRTLDRMRRPARAVPYLRRATELAPDNPAWHDALGMALEHDGKLPAAIDAFRAATRLNGEAALSWYHLGEAYRHGKQYPQAVAAQREAVRRSGKVGSYHAALGSALRLHGDLDEADAALRRAIELLPGNWWAHNELGLTLQSAGRLDDAIASFRRALQIQPTDAVIHANLGNTLAQAGRGDEALAAYQQAVKLDARLEVAHWQLGNALRNVGRFREAQEAMARATALCQERGGDLGPYGLRLKLCERLVALEPKREDALTGKLEPATAAERFDVALFCHYLGHPAAAAAYFSRAFADDPSLAGQSGARLVAALASVKAAAADDKEAARLRRQALDWLRADLASFKKPAGDQAAAELEAVRAEVARMRHHPALAPVRDPAALANLPGAERGEWQKFWAEAEARAGGGGREK